MKIIFITDSMHPGGSERVISVLANELASRGNHVEIFCLRGIKSFYALNSNVTLYCVEKEKPTCNIAQKSVVFRQHIKKEKPDVVIPFMTAVYCFALFSLIGLKQTTICSERIDPTKTSVFRKFLRALLLPRTDWLVVQTEQIKAYYKNSIQQKCSIIYNPISDIFFDDSPVERKRRIINVGRLAPQKNQTMLIDAFKEVHKIHPDFSLSIFGEGPLRYALQKLIDENGLHGVVILEGTSNNIAKELKSSYMACTASYFEGMSNAVLEAVCAGVPVVSTDVSGARELIGEDGGIVTPVNDKEAMISAMLRIIDNKHLAYRMSEANKSKRLLFATSTIVDQWENVIYSIVKRKAIYN